MSLADELDRALLARPEGTAVAAGWATVTQTNPLRVRLDGEATALPMTPQTVIGGLVVDDRVMYLWRGTRFVVIGRAQSDARILEVDRVKVTGSYLDPTDVVPRSYVDGLVEDSGWQDLTISGGFSAHASYGTPGVRIINGVAHFRGVITGTINASAGSTIATVPSGYRPPVTKFFPLNIYNSASRHGRMYVDAGGSVYAEVSSDGSVSGVAVNSITYPTD